MTLFLPKNSINSALTYDILIKWKALESFPHKKNKQTERSWDLNDTPNLEKSKN